MALWQYQFIIVPRTNESYDDCNYNKNRFEHELFWKEELVDKSLFLEIDSILTKKDSWCNNIDLYGDEESNCIEILFDNNNYIISVSFRLNFTDYFDVILEKVKEFCILKGLLILDEGFNLVPLNLEALKVIIQDSSQVKRYNDLLDTE